MSRVRVLFSKEQDSCFVSHVDLPVLFGRAARRAGIVVEMTEGFSPHPRTSFGPPLPVGVVGLREPAEFWIDAWHDDLLVKWNAVLPEGFHLLCAEVVDGASLSKLCEAACYVLRAIDGSLDRCVAEAVLKWGADEGCLLRVDDWQEGESGLRVALRNPDRYSASGAMKRMAADGLDWGWEKLLWLREDVGLWDDAAGCVIPLVRGAGRG